MKSIIRWVTAHETATTSERYVFEEFYKEAGTGYSLEYITLREHDKSDFRQLPARVTNLLPFQKNIRVPSTLKRKIFTEDQISIGNEKLEQNSKPAYDAFIEDVDILAKADDLRNLADELYGGKK